MRTWLICGLRRIQGTYQVLYCNILNHANPMYVLGFFTFLSTGICYVEVFYVVVGLDETTAFSSSLLLTSNKRFCGLADYASRES